MGYTLKLVRFPDDVQGMFPSLRTLHKIEENVLFPLGTQSLGNNPLPPEATSGCLLTFLEEFALVR